MNIDPWASETQEISYSKLFNEFGMQELSPELKNKISAIAKSKDADAHLISRDVIFGHRDLDLFVNAFLSKMPIAVLSGIKPSNDFHLGSKLTVDELIMYQRIFDAKVFYAIADLEAVADNNISLSQAHSFAVSNVADLLALGLDAKNCYIYKQSCETRVLSTGLIASTKVTNAMLEAVYGKRDISLYMCAMFQMADIFLPQHNEFGGKKHVLVPVGADQDPHIRLARDIAQKLSLILPSATYHKFMRGLDGNPKMSKRNPMSMISLNDNIDDIKKKIKNIFTGGRNTAEEQRKLGGEIQKCVFYDICLIHFIKDDKLLEQMKNDCISGQKLCGECKAKYGKMIIDFFEHHQQKRNKLIPVAEKLLNDKG